MKTRVLFFDIARALCILWIVCIWHLQDYIEWEGKALFMHVSENITNSALACFTFISGFFLGKRQLSFRNFYLSRLRRFIIPMVISCLLLAYIGWFESIWQFLFCVTGLSCFILPQPHTFWYISMLIVFYALTPMLIFKTKDKRLKILIRSSLIYAIFILLYMMGCCDERLLMYFPFYVCGMYLTMEHVMRCFSSRKFITTIFAFAVITFSITAFYNTGGGKILLMIFGTIFILASSFLLEKYVPRQIADIFSKVAYASMFAYLYHREAYILVRIVYHKVLLMQADCFILFITSVAIIIVSFYMQKYYDYLLGRCFSS